MSTGRSSNQPLKPSLASNRTARSPVTPKVSASIPKSPVSRSTLSIRSEPPAARANSREAPANDNITPRSLARKTHIDSRGGTPSRTDGTSTALGSNATVASSRTNNERGGVIGGLGVKAGTQDKGRVSRPNSFIGDGGASIKIQPPPLIRSPGAVDINQPAGESIDSRFFHASDAVKIEPAPKRPEPKKGPSFFYADGQQENRTAKSSITPSPVLSVGPDHRPPGSSIRQERTVQSQPLISPALSAISSTSPFFAPVAVQSAYPRPPSPSKESIHLSYRKGASQIFGTRPTPRPGADTHPTAATQGRPGSGELTANGTGHHKSSSLSSIDSGNSPQSRRRSQSAADDGSNSVPVGQEAKPSPLPRLAKLPLDLPSIDTSLGPPDVNSPQPEGALSPSKGASELAAEARRERKVLDLEISNSSLLAINASLEREVRRQKAELKRFRRLSRAGRFSFNPADRVARFSDGLSAVGEENENDELSQFGLPSGFSEMDDDFSDDDEDSLGSSEPLSPAAQSRRDSERLEKDEKRLQADLEKHKELLVQSQLMNQSIKRCMYATEDMIREGKKALDYHVRMSDVKLGGRVLSIHEEEDEGEQEVEVGGDTLHEDDAEEAKLALDVWSDVGRPSFESGMGGDRDSGIEVDRPHHKSLPLAYSPGHADSGRPPDVLSLTVGNNREVVGAGHLS